MSRLERWIPAAGWLRRYSRQDVAGDLAAGVTVAVMLVPQGMAYAMLAGLPPVVGLYASTVPLVLYALFGSSRQLAVGPVAIVSLLTLSGVSQLAEPGSADFVALAAMLALMTGVIQLGLGLVRAGFLTNFLSHAVISGFTSAAAIVIGLSQLKHLLGIDLASSHSVFGLLWGALRRLGEANVYTVAIGMASIAVLVVSRRLAPRFPAPLLVVAAGALATWGLRLHERGVSIVGDVPGGLPGFSLPAGGPELMLALLPTALTISFVGFMESVAVAKSIAAREKYRIDADQELKGLGLANLGTAVFSGFPVTGGFSRSAVNYQAGARTGLASIITAGLVTVTLLAFTGLFHYLPGAVLAAIVMVAVYGLIDVKEAVHLFQLKKVDGWTLVLTFSATLLVGIEQGILIGAAFSLLVFVWRSAYPHVARLGWLGRERVFRNVLRYPEVELVPGVVILRVDASLYFANMAFLENWLRSAVAEQEEVRTIILDFSGVNDMDAVAVETLEALMTDFRHQGVALHIAAMKGPVRDITARAGWPALYGRQTSHFSVEQALESLGVWPRPESLRETEVSA
ncbi:MAG TPA: solute carrier family 26 protein [Longimicrobiales bacterium]|nr:solute carrier family 26 protein [Longimicrobiales bacterium]